MGVAWVFESEQQAAAVERQMILAGASVVGVYSVDSTPYIPTEQGIGHLYLLHHSQFPQSAFCIMPQQSFKSSPRASFDKGFDFILPKLASGLKSDTSGKFEVAGSELALRDFRVRIGTATQTTQTKGVIVEVEYAPCCLASQAFPMLNEFIEMFFSSGNIKKPEVLSKKEPEPYGALETLYQYCLILSEMRQRA